MATYFVVARRGKNASALSSSARRRAIRVRLLASLRSLQTCRSAARDPVRDGEATPDPSWAGRISVGVSDFVRRAILHP
jgi:hypothetical protein